MSETAPPTTFADVTLLCKECGRPFIFTAKEQRFFVQQGFEHVPTRCADCRRLARDKREKGRQFASLKCRITGKIGRLPIEVDDPTDAYTAEAFEELFAQQGRWVDPKQEPDYTPLVEERRQAEEEARARAETEAPAGADNEKPAA